MAEDAFGGLLRLRQPCVRNTVLGVFRFGQSQLVFCAHTLIMNQAARFEDYLALAKRPRQTLEKIDGFVDNERFRSTRRLG